MFNEDYIVNDFGNAHNIAINTSSGFAYILGSALYEGGPVFYDISIPEQPILRGGFSDTSYIHDAQIITYKGEDQNYFGKEILLGSNSDGGETNQLIILDVTEKTNPVGKYHIQSLRMPLSRGRVWRGVPAAEMAPS